MSSTLAIVIPFYKLTYFESLLEALAAQSCQDFSLYIGDDCSPNDPAEVIRLFSSRMNITYHRFSERLGHKNLTQQWQRCLSLIQSEKWIWMIPDDDLPALNSVEAFYKALTRLQENTVKVFRFPLVLMDENGVETASTRTNPVLETNYDFFSRLVRGETISSLGDNIFHRASLEKTGGFVDFPKAWGSDHATVINVASEGFIYGLNEAGFRFRMSNENISSNRADGAEKMRARNMFACWLKHHERIFFRAIDNQTYRFFYWKGEHYVLNAWQFSVGTWLGLYQLRKTCFNSVNPLPVMWLFMKYAYTTIFRGHHAQTNPRPRMR